MDLDVHQGNGTASIFEHDRRVFTCSLHGAANFPFRKERSDLDVPLPDGTGDEAYLAHLAGALDTVLRHWPGSACSTWLARILTKAIASGACA